MGPYRGRCSREHLPVTPPTTTIQWTLSFLKTTFTSYPHNVLASVMYYIPLSVVKKTVLKSICHAIIATEPRIDLLLT